MRSGSFDGGKSGVGSPDYPAHAPTGLVKGSLPSTPSLRILVGRKSLGSQLLQALHGLGHMKHEQKMINHSPLASLVLSVCYHGNSDSDPVLSVPTVH